MPLDEITITLGGQDRLTVDVLKTQLENALDVLRNVESDFTTADTVVRWEIVRVRMRSPLKVTFAPNVLGKRGKTIGRKIVKACLDGMNEIEQTASAPPHFNDFALKAAKEMVSVAQKEGHKVTFASNGKMQVTLTQQAAKHIDEVVSKARRYTDVSTVEGNLEMVSVHDHPSFFIWETFTRHRVECLVDEAQLKDYFPLLNKRVAVTGTVKYRNHIPVSVAVEDIRVLRDASELPQPSDIGPINITDGVSSEEHVRRMRDG